MLRLLLTQSVPTHALPALNHLVVVGEGPHVVEACLLCAGEGDGVAVEGPRAAYANGVLRIGEILVRKRMVGLEL